MARSPLLVSGLTAAVVGAVTFWVAFSGGGYSAVDRGTLAIALLWALGLGVALGLWPAERVPSAALLVTALFAALTLFVGLQAFRADSVERSLSELNRTALFLGILLFAVVAARRRRLDAWLAGLAAALAAVGFVALASRLFPDLVSDTAELAQLFPSAQKRLSYPVDYWNGLATLVALAIPLLLYFATSLRSPLVRGVALAPIPALAGTAYLTSSRGGALSALIATVAYLLLCGRKWAAVGATLLAGAGSAVVIATLNARPELVNRPLESDLAVDQGRSAAFLILVVVLALGAVWALASRFAPEPPELPLPVRGALVVGLVALAVAGAVAAEPVERFERFKEVPPTLASASVEEHLLSGSSNGRWQLWEVAVDEFREEPLLGQGPGSYEAAWAQRGTLELFVRDAHSLYLETLAELGLVGFVLLAVVLLAGFAVGLRRLVGRRLDERSAVAALLALLAAYAFEAAFDWMWELTIVSAVAFVALGLLVGPGTAVAPAEVRRAGLAWPFRLAAVAGLIALLLVQVIPLLAELKVRDSRAAVEQDDLAAAVEDARAAVTLSPWAASPRLQLALVRELAGELDAAEDSIDEAIERDPDDWRLWLVAARIETKNGSFEEAMRSLDRAQALNPRSRLFDES